MLVADKDPASFSQIDPDAWYLAAPEGSRSTLQVGGGPAHPYIHAGLWERVYAMCVRAGGRAGGRVGWVGGCRCVCM